MFYWVLDLDEKGKPLMFGPFGPYWSFEKAEAYKDKNCSRMSRVGGPTKSRARAKAKEEDELKDDLRELLADRKAMIEKKKRFGGL
jgi:hypothetical protein